MDSPLASRLLAAAFAAGASCGCFSHDRLQSVHDFRRDNEPSVPPETTSSLRDFRGILHCHSIYSHDAKGTLEEIQDAAEKTGVDFVGMTDHTNRDAFTHGWRGFHGKVLFLLGQEISKSGSIVAVGSTRFVDPEGRTAQEIIDDVVAAGGLAFIGHYEKTSTEGIGGYTGVGIVNLHATWREQGAAVWVGALGNLAYSGAYADEVFQETLTYRPLVDANLRRWDALTRQRRAVAISETDAHGVARFAGIQIDSYARLFRVVSTHVLAKQLDERSILDALAAGHAYVAFDGYGKSAGFAFEALRGTEVVAMQGDEVDLAPTGRLVLLARVPIEARLRLVRDGEVVGFANGQRLWFDATAPGVYRIEAELTIRGSDRPWIYSNPIYVR
ncbi:MAG: PHP domain-containing protein [Planctomycetes bacterium]|nr:PHP domain-containing protein [Planctomycetota bacterium]